MRYTFTKRGSVDGFTLEEALDKATELDAQYGVYDTDSRWKPATYIPDHNKLSGYKVVIETKSKNRALCALFLYCKKVLILREPFYNMNMVIF